MKPLSIVMLLYTSVTDKISHVSCGVITAQRARGSLFSIGVLDLQTAGAFRNRSEGADRTAPCKTDVREDERPRREPMYIK